MLAAYLGAPKLAFSCIEKMKMRLIKTLLIASLLLVTTACREQPLADLPAETVLEGAVARMTAVSGFHFMIDRSGAPAYFDSAETLNFRQAEGDYVTPDRARAVVRIIAPGLVTDVSVVSVGAIQWETNVLTGQWEELPPDWGFNPTVLFDSQLGLPAILSLDLSNLARGESGKLDDGSDQLLYQLTADVTGERLYQMSGGLIGPGPVSATLWIAPETFELHRILVVEPAAGSEEASIWQVDFGEFDLQLEIEPPTIK